jgi:hypothetical protein
MARQAARQALWITLRFATIAVNIHRFTAFPHQGS